eukprot:scaffold11242_cov16-Tisochrysis_lutea.AAC.2
MRHQKGAITCDEYHVCQRLGWRLKLYKKTAERGKGGLKIQKGLPSAWAKLWSITARVQTWKDMSGHNLLQNSCRTMRTGKSRVQGLCAERSKRFVRPPGGINRSKRFVRSPGGTPRSCGTAAAC